MVAVQNTRPVAGRPTASFRPFPSRRRSPIPAAGPRRRRPPLSSHRSRPLRHLPGCPRRRSPAPVRLSPGRIGCRRWRGRPQLLPRAWRHRSQTGRGRRAGAARSLCPASPRRDGGSRGADAGRRLAALVRACGGLRQPSSKPSAASAGLAAAFHRPRWLPPPPAPSATHRAAAACASVCSSARTAPPPPVPWVPACVPEGAMPLSSAQRKEKLFSVTMLEMFLWVVMLVLFGRVQACPDVINYCKSEVPSTRFCLNSVPFGTRRTNGCRSFLDWDRKEGCDAMSEQATCILFIYFFLERENIPEDEREHQTPKASRS